jgi:DNA primase
MSPRIPKAFISELIARADLLEVVGARVQLKKAGSNYKGLCPFHDEKTPSFTIRPDKGFFKCFGCGAYGNAIDFIMQFENRAFPEAIEILADILRMEIPVEQDAPQVDNNSGLYAVLDAADRLYRERLREHVPAIAYLKARGIDGTTAARFGLGFAPDAWDTLSAPVRDDAGRTETLIDAGLSLRSDNGRVYDRFRNRITFPIRDSRGRVIGFGGRVLGNDEPKYLNSPDTPLFDKSRTLYGLYEARQQPGRPETLIVVEGYMDVIALTQNGIRPAIATMGTATTAENVKQLTRFSDRVVFCFDGDRAGRSAAWRALESVLPYGGGSVELGFMLLPDGEDPDSYVRVQGPESFQSLVDSAQPLSSFLVQQAMAGIDLTNADGKARLISKCRPLIERLARGVYRDLVTVQLAESVGMTADAIELALEKRAGQPTFVQSRSVVPQKVTVIRKLLTLALHYPAAAAKVGPVDGLEEIDAPGAELLRQVLAFSADTPNLNSAALVEAFRDDPEGKFLGQLAAEEPLDSEEAAAAVLHGSLERLVQRQRRARQAAALRAKPGEL